MTLSALGRWVVFSPEFGLGTCWEEEAHAASPPCFGSRVLAAAGLGTAWLLSSFGIEAQEAICVDSTRSARATYEKLQTCWGGGERV